MVPAEAPLARDGGKKAVSASLIYFSPIPWRGLHQRPQHCCRLLSEHFRVLWVEPKTLHLPSPPRGNHGLAHIALPVIPTNARRGALRGMARAAAAAPLIPGALRRLQRSLLLRRCAELKLESPVLLFGHPEFYPLRDAFPRSRLAYDHMDDILRFGDPSPGLSAGLRSLVREADLVNATSTALAEGMREMGARRVLQTGNGVEWDHFARDDDELPEPAELAMLPRPRAIYTGSVAEWFDFPLLYETASALPDVAFPVLGPLRPALRGVAEIAPPNVHFLGARPYGELPAWLANCQAALIPFLRTPLTAGVDPVKLYEYLAVGLPVIATPFSPELPGGEGGVALAGDAAAITAARRDALASPPDRAGRRLLAEPHRWERRLAPLLQALVELSAI